MSGAAAVERARTLSPRVRLVCPHCRTPLVCRTDRFDCEGCGRSYGTSSGFPDLIVGERFADETDDEQLRYEEQSNRDLARSYLTPLFRRLWRGGTRPARILSLGCGAGTDVEVLSQAGFDCVGVDCGNRTAAWPRRADRSRFFLANGQRLPFEDAQFDFVFCGCLFPHVGVVGDSFEVTRHYRGDRLALAREMSRVLAEGGRVLASSPNRWCLLDLFHGREAGSYRPRWNAPWDPFLLSLADYRSLFEASGLLGVRTLPVAGYWSFCRSRASWKGALLGAPVRLLFRLVSSERLGWLRASAMSPWLVVCAEKR